MTRNKNTVLLFMAIALLCVFLSGCGGNLNTVGTCVLSNEQYAVKDALESAAQPESLEAGKEIYASVLFFESPLGMEYAAKWYVDGKEVKTETKETKRDRSDIIIFSLEAGKVTAGKLKFEILYGDDVLFSKELSVE
jgi:hypothetical protein